MSRRRRKPFLAVVCSEKAKITPRVNPSACLIAWSKTADSVIVVWKDSLSAVTSHNVNVLSTDALAHYSRTETASLSFVVQGDACFGEVISDSSERVTSRDRRKGQRASSCDTKSYELFNEMQGVFFCFAVSSAPHPSVGSSWNCLFDLYTNWRIR